MGKFKKKKKEENIYYIIVLCGEEPLFLNEGPLKEINMFRVYSMKNIGQCVCDNYLLTTSFDQLKTVTCYIKHPPIHYKQISHIGLVG